MTSPTVQAGKRATYSAYKPSGVPWIGEIPEHWKVKALKRTFTTLNGATPRSGDPDYWDGDIPWATPDDLGNLTGSVLLMTRRMITELGYASCGVSLAPKGSLILSTRAPIGHLAVAGVNMGTNQGCRSLVFRKDDDRRFFFYQLFAARPELQSLGQGSTFTELSRDRLTAVYLASPRLDEQKAIAAFLDRETARIDVLIEKKRRQIKLLQEQRSALISHAVTKGLNPNAPMKDSGIEGMGGMPAHWDLKRLKFIAPQVTVGIVITPSKYYEESGIPCLRSLNVRPDELTENDPVFISPESNELLCKSKLRAGDVVVVRTGKPGTAAVVDERFDGANCIDLIIVRKSRRFDSRFMCYVLNSEFALAQYVAGTSGAIQGHFNIETACNMLIPVPPVVEQVRIRERLDLEIGKLKLMGLKVEESITRLREHRTALISAAVTGKIDVRAEEASA